MDPVLIDPLGMMNLIGYVKVTFIVKHLIMVKLEMYSALSQLNFFLNHLLLAAYQQIGSWARWYVPLFKTKIHSPTQLHAHISDQFIL